MPLKQATAAGFKGGDIFFDMIDEHGSVVLAHVEGEALIAYAVRHSMEGEPEEILERALLDILRVASDKFDSYPIKPSTIYVLTSDLNPKD